MPLVQCDLIHEFDKLRMVARLCSISPNFLMHIIHAEIQEKGMVIDVSWLGIDVHLNTWLPLIINQVLT